MATQQITVTVYTCERCGHTWQARTDDRPRTCPNRTCRSVYWDRPRREKKEKAGR